MKILFVNEYSPDRPVSGAEHSQAALAKALKAIVFTPRWKTNLPGQSLSPLWFNNPIYYLLSAWQILKQDFDLIHVHGKYILPGAIIAGWLTHKPVIATVRDFKFLCPLALCFTHQQKKCSLSYFYHQEIPDYQTRYHPTSRLRLILAKLWQYQLKWFLNRCQKIIAVSPQLAKIYQDNGVKKVISIYNLPPIGSRGKRPVNKNIILSVGKLSFGKGTDVLIKVAQLLPKVKFILCGAKNPSFKLDFPPNCQYLGKLNHSEVLKQYAQASVFCLLSRWPEPLSRAGLEALSFGLPLVASDRGGNKELIQDNGYLVNLAQPNLIAKALTQTLNNYSNFSQNSLKLLQTRFNRSKIINQHLKLYRQLI